MITLNSITIIHHGNIMKKKYNHHINIIECYRLDWVHNQALPKMQSQHSFEWGSLDLQLEGN